MNVTNQMMALITAGNEVDAAATNYLMAMMHNDRPGQAAALRRLAQASGDWRRVRDRITPARDFAEGTRVEGGEPGTDDYDTGRIVLIDSDRALVAWDTGVRTWANLEDLRPL
jgi:hypothetical protein